MFWGIGIAAFKLRMRTMLGVVMAVRRGMTESVLYPNDNPYSCSYRVGQKTLDRSEWRKLIFTFVPPLAVANGLPKITRLPYTIALDPRG